MIYNAVNNKMLPSSVDLYSLVKISILMIVNSSLNLSFGTAGANKKVIRNIKTEKI